MMNTNEELKTRPDFEKLLKPGAFKSHPLNLEKDAVRIDFAESVCEDLWTTHVEPLQAEVEYQKGKKHDILQFAKANRKFYKKLCADLHSENQKLREQLKVGVKIAELMIKYCNERNDGNTALIVEANLKSLIQLETPNRYGN